MFSTEAIKVAIFTSPIGGWLMSEPYSLILASAIAIGLSQEPMAGTEGFEPPRKESKSFVLPLHQIPICNFSALLHQPERESNPISCRIELRRMHRQDRLAWNKFAFSEVACNLNGAPSGTRTLDSPVMSRFL